MEEDEVEESQTNQENDESNSLKRPKTERDPDYTEEESPEKAPQGAETKTNTITNYFIGAKAAADTNSNKQ